MKKKLILMGIAGALVVTTIIGGSLALVRTSSSGQATSDITTKDLGIGIYEDNTEAIDGEIIVKTKVPGETVSKNLVIKNTKTTDTGYDTYVRVTIYKTWGEMSDSQNKIFIKDSSLEQLDQIILGISQDPNWYLSTVASTNEETVLYYKVPIKPGESTTPFLNSIKIDESLGNKYADKSILLDIDADAVQVIDGVDAISSAWGISVSVNNLGEIISIAE